MVSSLQTSALLDINFFLFFFSLLHLWHMEVPRLGMDSKLQLQAYTTVWATPDPSCICDLCRSLRQCQILNSLSPGIELVPAQTLCWVFNLPYWVFNLPSHKRHSLDTHFYVSCLASYETKQCGRGTEKSSFWWQVRVMRCMMRYDSPRGGSLSNHARWLGF